MAHKQQKTPPTRTNQKTKTSLFEFDDDSIVAEARAMQGGDRNDRSYRDGCCQKSFLAVWKNGGVAPVDYGAMGRLGPAILLSISCVVLIYTPHGSAEFTNGPSLQFISSVAIYSDTHYLREVGTHQFLPPLLDPPTSTAIITARGSSTTEAATQTRRVHVQQM